MMARFQRTFPAPVVKGGYGSFRRFVQADFQRVCAYCLFPEKEAAGEENFEIDHFKPKKLFKGHHITDFYNLYWSCHVCNKAKWEHWPPPELLAIGIRYVDLCVDLFDDHYEQLQSGHLRFLTDAGEYTIEKLNLNRPHLVKIRCECALRGVYFR